MPKYADEGHGNKLPGGHATGKEHPDGDKSIGGFIGTMSSFNELPIKKVGTKADRSHPADSYSVPEGPVLKP